MVVGVTCCDNLGQNYLCEKNNKSRFSINLSFSFWYTLIVYKLVYIHVTCIHTHISKRKRHTFFCFNSFTHQCLPLWQHAQGTIMQCQVVSCQGYPNPYRAFLTFWMKFSFFRYFFFAFVGLLHVELFG